MPHTIPPSAASSVDRGVRPVWPAAALSGFAVFICCALLLHLRRPDLDLVHSQMSLYLIGAWGPLLQAGYVALSAGMVALAWGLRQAMSTEARSAAPLLLFVLGGLSLTTTAYAWMDLPGIDRTLEGLIHIVSAQGAFLLTTTAMVLQALRFRRDPDWARHVRWALPWALVCFASIWLLAVWRDAPRGIAQKAVIASMLGWLACVGALLWRRARPAVRRSA